ncbi:hypothetical protein F0U60_17030 [Archangium minus]|uniref:Uncharacterized protein n=1 Tax=Archangium minus TaxID=83450 RepID=A0ABY9WP82_9BACT|nr:hypothetical protein F0U61_16885 [Archangium violaceum]WNG45614.1 hypothetical protein F0U60_17030 [Archangium minus]
MAKPAGFDKDIGYLMPFMDRVAAAAGALPDASAREELTRLMAEEKVRWARIQQLLEGAPGRSTAGGVSPPATTVVPRNPAQVPEPARARADGINRVAPRAAGLTVGSLKRKS